MSGVEGTTLVLAKHLLVMWRWSLLVWCEEVCPPAPTVACLKLYWELTPHTI